MTHGEEYAAAMADATVQAIWWGTPDRERYDNDGVHLLAMADRAAEMGLDDVASLWREIGEKQARRFGGR